MGLIYAFGGFFHDRGPCGKTPGQPAPTECRRGGAASRGAPNNYWSCWKHRTKAGLPRFFHALISPSNSEEYLCRRLGSRTFPSTPPPPGTGVACHGSLRSFIDRRNTTWVPGQPLRIATSRMQKFQEGGAAVCR